MRVLRQGLLTVGGFAPRGWFIPHRYAGQMPPPKQPYALLEQHFNQAESVFDAVLDTVDSYGDRLLSLEGAPPTPRFEQGWFPRLDAATAYALVRARRPRRIVEIGSGHSTRFLAQAVADGGLDTEIHAIDPQPRADVNALPIQVHRCLVQDAPDWLWSSFRPGDVLLVDSSHIVMPGTDLDLLVSRILPLLPAEVLVHVHDIFLPDPYPESWNWRGYNEQQLIAGLLAGGGFRLVMASHYVVTRMAGRLADGVVGQLPLWPGVPETSIWLEKTSPALVTIPTGD